MRTALATVAILFAGAVLAGVLGTGNASAVDPPHGPYTITTEQCATCHRGHTARNKSLVPNPPAQSNLCFTCHNGTGSSYNVAAEYADVFVPANQPATRSYYSHPATTDLGHTSGLDPAEFAGVQNRHSECSDCHNSHKANAALPAMSVQGWSASGSIAGATGVQATSLNGGVATSWQDPVQKEYQLCLKCHSSYTLLLPNPPPPGAGTPYPYTYLKTDKAAEVLPATGGAIPYVNASLHPVAAPGTNTSVQMANSLAGGAVFKFSPYDTIRCTNCHGNYRAVGTVVVGPGTPTPVPKAPTIRLAPHTSQYRSLLIANYVDRVLKVEAAVFNANDFALCFACHSAAPFSTTSKNERADTRFEFHGFHLTSIDDKGDPALGTDINRPGAGQGNAICAECHFELHSTKFAYTSSNRTYTRLVNFSPNILPRNGVGPQWVQAVDGSRDGSCTLTCHGKEHGSINYGRWVGGNGAAPTPTPGGMVVSPNVDLGGAPGGTSGGGLPGTTGGTAPSTDPLPGATTGPGTPTPEPTSTPIPTPKPIPTPVPGATPVPQPLGTDECNGRDCGPTPYRVICGPRGWFIDVGYDFDNRWGWSEYEVTDIREVRAVCAQ